MSEDTPEKNTFLVFDPEYPLRSALEIPGGRKTYINFMLEHERQEGIDDGFTEEENQRLYGMQFDTSQAYSLWENKLISREMYELVEEGANSIKSQIRAAAAERKKATSE